MICSHCKEDLGKVMVVAITAGIHMLPVTHQRDLCETCKDSVLSGIESVMNDTTMEDFG